MAGWLFGWLVGWRKTRGGGGESRRRKTERMEEDGDGERRRRYSGKGYAARFPKGSADQNCKDFQLKNNGFGHFSCQSYRGAHSEPPGPPKPRIPFPETQRASKTRTLSQQVRQKRVPSARKSAPQTPAGVKIAYPQPESASKTCTLTQKVDVEMKDARVG